MAIANSLSHKHQLSVHIRALLHIFNARKRHDRYIQLTFFDGVCAPLLLSLIYVYTTQIE